MAIVAVIVLIILCLLIILGAGLNAILFLLVQPYVPVTPRPVMAVVVGVELDATVKLSNRAFVPAYNNELSPQYQELSQTFTNTMDAVFLNSDLSDIYNGTVVNGFTQGSVIVNFTINLIRAPTAPTVTGSTTMSSGVGSIDDQINSVRGQVEVSIKEIIQIADDNGDLTTLGVDSTTLSVTDVSVDVETTTVTETPATTIAPSTKTPDEEPPVLVCPDDVTAETEAGAAFGIISWTSPTATDNSGEVTVETDFVPGQLPIGSRNITVTATDASGNTAECVIVATVVDIEAPIAICPEDITRNTDLGQAYATISWSSPRGTDNSGTISSINADPREGQFAIGSHVITVTVVDPAGLEGQCTFDIVVQDNEAPTLECPATIEVSTDVGSPSSIVTWTVLGQDNSGSVSSLSSSPSPGESFAISTTTVVVTALDQSGNMGQCSFNVIVFDSELPVITCPASIIQATDLGSSSATVMWQVTAADNSGDPPTITSSHEPGMLSFGTLTVVAMAIDSSENTASCSFTVQIVDEEAPLITCPNNITVATDVGASSAIITWAGPFASDNTGQATAMTDISLGLWPIGIQTVTGTAVDGSGNEAQCTFWVNVQDLENPVVLCPADITSELVAVPVTWDATATDNSEMIANLTSSPSTSDVVLGTNTVTVIAMDPSGNKAECSFVVILTDTTAPTITCPDDVSGTLAAEQSSVTLAWVEPSATDLSGDVTVTASHSSGDYSIGQVNVTASATDSSGNQASCFFLVTVTDMQDPMISSCPPSQSVNTDNGLATAVVSWTPPTAWDNSGSVSLTSHYSSGDPFPIGSTQVTYTATDGSGNSVMTCTFDIAVHDNEKPVISGCPSDQNVTTDFGNATAVVTWTPPTATDNSGYHTLTSTDNPGDYFPIGNNTVTYYASDDAGNTETCTFFVVVSDNEKPVISRCPSDQNVTTYFGNATAVVTWTPPTATDNSGNQTLTSTDNPGDYFPIGNNTVTYYASDDAGNIKTCTFFVVVSDNEKPVISGCPSDQNVTTDFGNATAVVTWTPPTATDKSGNQTLTSTDNPGDYFPIGNNKVTYYTSDDAGNTEICTFFVVVSDNEKPVMSGCPSDQNVTTDFGNATAVVTWTPPTATDNSGNQTLTSTDNPGDYFPIGNNTVTYYASDDAGNTEICTFFVVVSDNEKPVISGCPSDQNVTTDFGNATAVVTWTPPTATDNSGNQTLTSSHNSGDYFPIGNNTVTYTSTDGAGNTETCTFNLVVTDPMVNISPLLMKYII
ncbi:hyalin isoform X2 [Strongylocentrotus purpuratus]|uniref:Hyalin n=1 Tax=Strongylocentrotus purpuratus TaxID=7668 RepID=A0A7M7SXT1_STRPU|nr:hyalin isoform X2 [Strongylocentrotus purpuratus]